MRYTFVAVLLLLHLVGAPASAEPPIVFELYSWPQGSDWRFSVWEGTTTVRSPPVVKTRKQTLRGFAFLKGRLADLPARSHIYWRDKPEQGFPLPSQEIIRDLKTFAEGAQIKLLLPGDSPPSTFLD